MLLIGIGNAFRRDDGAGLAVAERVAALAPPGVEVVAHHGEGAELMELWRGREAVIVVDAVSSGQPAGTIRRFDAEREALPAELFCFSSHAFGVAQAVEMARALGGLPGRLRVIGIEGEDFGHGQGLGPAVAAAVAAVAAEIVAAR